MEIYGRTEKVIVREMIESDVGSYLELMKKRGIGEDFTMDDIRALWAFRNNKGDLQCTITNIDGNIIYGFCGVLQLKTENPSMYADVFDEYVGKGYREQAMTVIETR